MYMGLMTLDKKDR